MLEAEKKECAGSEINLGKLPSLAMCANQCEQKASMFAYATTEDGIDDRLCEDKVGCKCLCETAATPDGSCHQVVYLGYTLYKYVSKGNLYSIFDTNIK